MSRSLPIEISRFQNSHEIMGDLAESVGLEGQDDAAQAYAGCAPVIVKALVERCSTSTGAARMINSARALTWQERHNPAELFKNGNPLVGEDVADQIFDDALPSVVDAVASSSGMSERSAGSLIEIASAVTLALLADEPDRDLTFNAFSASIDRAAQAFGIESNLPTSDDNEGHDHASEIAAYGAKANSSDGASRRVGAAGAGLAAGAAGAAGAAAIGTQPSTSVGGAVAAEQQSVEQHSVEQQRAEQHSVEPHDVDNNSADDEKKKRGALVPLLGVGALCAAGLIGYAVLSGSGGSNPDSLAFDGSPTTLEVVTTAEAAEVSTTQVATTTEVEADTTTAEAEPVASNGDDILTLSVPMDNKTGASADASGVLTFDFNTKTGGVCYTIEAENIEGPFRSHIHVGSEGEDGGIVVDLDPRQSGDTGCLENAVLDSNTILGDLDGHYAELHDVSEEWTIRGQLSESPEAEAVAAVMAQTAADNAESAEAENSTGEGSEVESADELVLDVDGDGANILLKDGDLILQGQVADQATADALLASFDDVSTTIDVINNLEIVEGSPAPSGRVVIADAIFFDDNSDVVKDIDAPTLAAITALAQSRDDWRVTIVGHTDSRGSATNNLELSLRRANAVRDLILAEGVPQDSLLIRGSGETDPVGDNSTEEGRAQNRRIEFEFSPAS